MSQIIINEQEQVGYNSFDATENVVLVPLFTTKTGDNSDRAQLFSTLKEFRAVYPDEEGAPKLNSEKDMSYFFIRELLNAGLKVVVKPFKSDTDTANLSLKQLVNYRVGAGLFDEFGSKNLWNIKFITTGYWPNRFVSDEELEDEELEESSESSESSETPAATEVGCYGTLIKLASDRNDCVAVIEFDDKDLEPEKFLKIINKEQAGDDYKYGVCSYPSITVNLVTLAGTTIRNKDNITVPTAMPAAFGYLMAFANSVRTNANWFAASGIIRGVIPNLVDVKSMLNQYQIRSNQAVNNKIKGLRDILEKIKKSYVLQNPLASFEIKEQKLDELINRLNTNVTNKLEHAKVRYNNLINKRVIKHPEEMLIPYKNQMELVINKLELLNPLNVLKKGYTVTEVNNKPLKSIKDVKVKDELKIKVIDGEIDAVVEGVK